MAVAPLPAHHVVPLGDLHTRLLAPYIPLLSSGTGGPQPRGDVCEGHLCALDSPRACSMTAAVLQWRLPRRRRDLLRSVHADPRTAACRQRDACMLTSR